MKFFFAIYILLIRKIFIFHICTPFTNINTIK